MSKKIIQAGRGAMLAKVSLAIRTVHPILLSSLENGNRAARRMVAKQKLAKGKK